MNLGDIGLLFRRELRSALRERSIVLYTFLAPVLLYPAIIWLVFSVESLVSGLQEQVPLRVALLNVPAAQVGLRVQVARDSRMVLRDSVDPDGDVRADRLDAVLAFQAREGSATALAARIILTGARTRSRLAADRLRQHVEAWRDISLEHVTRQAGLAASDLQILWLAPRNLTSERQLGRFALSIMLPVSLIMFLAFGGLYPAVDTTAGERERNTFETLLLTAASRLDIAVAKYLYVVVFSLASGLLNLAVVLACLKALLAPASGVSIDLPVSALCVIVPGALLLAMFTSAVLMVLSAFARTFQQGQSLASPFFLLIALPGIMTADPGATFSLPVAFIPVVNVAMAFREAVAGRFPLPQLGVTMGVLALGVIGSLWVASRMLSREDVLLGSHGGSFWKLLHSGRGRKSA